jgi:hypothetical protein
LTLKFFMLFLKYTKTVSERNAKGFLLPSVPFLPLSIGRVFRVSPLFSISYGRLFRKASTVAPSLTPFFSITYGEIGGLVCQKYATFFGQVLFVILYTTKTLGGFWEVPYV